MLVGIAIDREVQQIRADATVVQQRVSFAGRTVTDDSRTLALAPDQQLEQLPFRFGNSPAERGLSRGVASPAAFSIARTRRTPSSSGWLASARQANTRRLPLG